MSTPRYLWRQLTPKQREEVLAWRKDNARPWHSPPHRPNYGHLHFLVSAACYEHASHIGFSLQRMDGFSATLLELFQQHASKTVAWCVLPNHYHALVETPNILKLLHELGRLHGRTSHAWNGEESTRGRQVFHRATERFMRSERHLFASVIMFITTRCIMATCGCGQNGRGAARLNTWNRWAVRKLSGCGRTTRSEITARSGMTLGYKVGSPGFSR